MHVRGIAPLMVGLVLMLRVSIAFADFQPPSYSPGAPWSPVVGDFDNDGVPDVVAVNATGGSISARLGSGNGTLLPGIDSAIDWRVVPHRFSIGDFNRDGNLDLACTRVVEAIGDPKNVALILGNGDGTFRRGADIALPDLHRARTLAVGDLNDDGVLDLAVGAYALTGRTIPNDGIPLPICNRYLYVLLGNCDGSFHIQARVLLAKNGVNSGAPGVAVADFTGDARPDILTRDDDYRTLVWRSDRNGTLAKRPIVGTTSSGDPEDVADLDADGRLDFVDWDGHALFGHGDGTFRVGPFFTQYDRAVGDVNRDGKLDVVVVAGASLIIFLGNGDGTFPTTRQQGIDPGFGISSFPSLADFDGDCWLDILPGGIHAPDQGLVGVLLLLNDRHW